MRLVLAAAFIILLPVCNAYAQKLTDAAQAMHYLNDSVEVGVRVTKFRQTPDSILLFGEGSRKNKLMVILKDSAYHKMVILKDWAYRKMKPRWRSYPVHATLIVKGVIRNFKGHPCLVVNDTFDEIINPDMPKP